MYLPIKTATVGNRAIRDIVLLLQINSELGLKAMEAMLQSSALALARQKLALPKQPLDEATLSYAAEKFLDALASETFQTNGGDLSELVARTACVIDGEYKFPDFFLGENPCHNLLRLSNNCVVAAEEFHDTYKFLAHGAVNGYMLEPLKDMLDVSIEPDWRTDPADKMKQTFDQEEYKERVLNCCLEKIEDSIQIWRNAFFARLIATPNHSIDIGNLGIGDLS